MEQVNLYGEKIEEEKKNEKMEEKKGRLCTLLKKLFCIEVPDRDYGIYRIAKIKRDKIEQFIDATVKKIDNMKIINPEDAFTYVYDFFNRYFVDGDFIPRRRLVFRTFEYGIPCKPSPDQKSDNDEFLYVPYNGEEVLVYWATRDMYYVKTTILYHDYRFTAGNYTILFKIKNARMYENTPKEQRKLYVIFDEIVWDHKKNELTVYFMLYDKTGEKSKQKNLDNETEEKIQEGNAEDSSEDSVEKDAITEENNENEKRSKQKKINDIIIENIRREIQKNNETLFQILDKKMENSDETVLEWHLREFTEKNRKEYFIHKHLKEFLESELDFYIQNKILKLGDAIDSMNVDEIKTRIEISKLIKDVCVEIIEFLAQLEEFQKKLWEKKKFVISTHYVITLDKINEYARAFLDAAVKEIISNERQIAEWKELFEIEVTKESDLWEEQTKIGGTGKEKIWKKLPLDTQFFSEKFKLQLLEALTQHHALDDILDGVLIKSDNWQALNLLLEKYKGAIQTIYIDPPFNKEQEADYLYSVKYKDSTWCTLLENRIRLGREFLNEQGSIFVRCDYNGNWLVRPLMNEIFGKENFRNEIVIPKTKEFFKTMKHIKKFSEETESLFWFSKTKNIKFHLIYRGKKKTSKYPPFLPAEDKNFRDYREINGKIYYSPKGRKWGIEQEDVETLIEQKRLVFENGKWYLVTYQEPVKNHWLDDFQGYSRKWNFDTENSEALLKRVIDCSSDKGDLVMDFFIGSGTTTAVAHKLGRKWLGIEMGEHFWSVVLPRMKKVLYYDKSGISKEVKEYQGGGFFKYQVLEQYDDTLLNIGFKDEKTLEEFRDYFLKYMLDFETKYSDARLNVDKLHTPFDYKLKILFHNQIEEFAVDLIETFNYLLGLKVEGWRTFKNGSRTYVVVTGKTGQNSVIVIWRDIRNINYSDDRKFIENNILKNEIFDIIYINGYHTVPNGILLDNEFKRRMGG
ncbi:MAG: site-specific DNA-methyltransferase [Thermoplasmata archaeon]